MGAPAKCRIVFQFPESFAAWKVVDLGVVAFLSPKTVLASASAGKMEYRDVLRYVRNKKVSPYVEWAKGLKSYPYCTQEEDVLVQNNSAFETKEHTGRKASPQSRAQDLKGRHKQPKSLFSGLTFKSEEN